MGEAKRPATVGIALCGDFLYGVAVQWFGATPRVVGSARVALHPRDLGTDGVPADLAAGFESVLKRLRCRPRHVFFATEFANHRTRSVEFHWIPEPRRDALLRAELDAHGLLKAGEGGVGALWIETAPDGGDGPLRGSIAFLPEAELSAWEQAAAAVGRRFEGLEPEPVAAIRAAVVGIGSAPALLLHVGRDAWEVFVVDGNRFVLHRRIPGGSRSRTEGQTSNPMQQPESSEPAPPLGMAPIGTTGSFEAETHAGFLASELGRTLAFHQRSRPSDAPFPCLWTVGQALPPNLALAVERALGIPVVDAYPATLPEPTDPSETAGWVAGYGVALGGSPSCLAAMTVGRTGKDAVARRRAPGVIRAATIATVLVLVGSSSATIGLVHAETQWNSRRTAWMQSLAETRRQHAPRWRDREDASAVDQFVSEVALPVSEVLHQLEAAAQPGISLKKLNMPGLGRWECEGDALGADALRVYVAGWEGSGSSEPPRLRNVRLDAGSRVRFVLATGGPAEGATSP